MDRETFKCECCNDEFTTDKQAICKECGNTVCKYCLNGDICNDCMLDSELNL
jgi:hypothetical protein